VIAVQTAKATSKPHAASGSREETTAEPEKSTTASTTVASTA
jgi:hypothetical protein